MKPLKIINIIFLKMSSKILSPICLTLLLIPLIFYISCQEERVYKNLFYLSSSNFTKIVLDQKYEECEWIIFFTAKESSWFTQNILLNIVRYFDIADKIKFGVIDCDVEKYLPIRFEIRRMPHMISIKNKRMYSYNDKITYQTVKEFINYPKNPRESDPLPYEASFIRLKIRKFLNQFNVSIQNVLDKLGISIVWDVKKTYALMLVHLMFLVMIANGLVSFCDFGKSKKRKGSFNDEEKLVDKEAKQTELKANEKNKKKKKGKKLY